MRCLMKNSRLYYKYYNHYTGSKIASLIVVLSLLCQQQQQHAAISFAFPSMSVSSKASQKAAAAFVQSEIGWSKLAKAWARHFIINNENTNNTTKPVIVSALERTIPLLQSDSKSSNPSTAVPFVCRYRQDVIKPLSIPMVHQLAEYVQTHQSLENTRKRILEKITNNNDDKNLIVRIQTSISKTELDDLYAPYKAPSKGTLEERIIQKYPDILTDINEYWTATIIKKSNSSASNNNISIRKLLSKYDDSSAIITLLANRIASNPDTIDSCYEYIQRFCKINIQRATATKKGDDDDNNNKTKKKQKVENNTYQTYYDMEISINRLRDHQVLAIRRGIEQKQLKMSFDIDNDRIERTIYESLFGKNRCDNYNIWKNSIHDSWTRLLRKKCTNRIWKDCIDNANQRGIQVFCDNLYKTLLKPPLSPTPYAILGIDPGYKAGIKTVIIDQYGNVIPNTLQTIHYINNYNNGEKQMTEILQSMINVLNNKNNKSKDIVVALGNGHGTQEARKLLMECVEECDNIDEDNVKIHLVNEAGASVWSVTEVANTEFPNIDPTSIASISIARRLQNPLIELIKIPPKSLGIGMYQHDFPEKTLQEKLNISCIDAVAEIGVDGNTCNIHILEKIPSITHSIATKIIQSRPIKCRTDIQNISGIGPKTYQNSIAFIRIANSIEPLDNTLCHPESYNLARYLLKELQWDLHDPTSVKNIPLSQNDRKNILKGTIKNAAKKFMLPEDRILSVIDHLFRSITCPDPRLSKTGIDGDTVSNNNDLITKNLKNCIPLPNHLSSLDELQKVCPVRNIIGHVRNIVDFGIFIDFGCENDGLLHRSKFVGTNITSESILVGQEIGIDILGISSSSNKKISLGLAGMNNPAESIDDKVKTITSSTTTTTTRKRQVKKLSGSKTSKNNQRKRLKSSK